MLLVYDSFTGNVKRFVSKLPYRSISVAECADISEPFCLVTYTIGFGNVPKATANFLVKYSEHLVAVASSGNRNWGSTFAKAAEIISSSYRVPIIHQFEMSGEPEDVDIFIQNMSRLNPER